MAVIRTSPTDGSSGIEWMAMVAFLGAIYCTVLGVFKRFSASMSFGTSTRERVVEVAPRAVYRTFAESDSFITTREGANGSSPAVVPPVAPNAEPKVPRPKKTAPLPPAVSNINNGQAGSSSNLVSSEPGPSGSSTSNTDKKTKKPKTKDENKDKSKPKKDKDEIKRKEKEDKARKEKKEKEKKEKKEKKDKKDKTKDDKGKKVKNKAPSRPVASVTIDEAAVASTQAAVAKQVPPQGASLNPIARNPTIAPPPYQEEDVFAKTRKNETGNIRGTPANKPPESEPKGFASSWDQVAQHRQNMHREIKTFSAPTKNLRAMASQSTVDGRDVNSQNSSRSNQTISNNNNRKYSPPSDISSGQESDTEA